MFSGNVRLSLSIFHQSQTRSTLHKGKITKFRQRRVSLCSSSVPRFPPREKVQMELLWSEQRARWREPKKKKKEFRRRTGSNWGGVCRIKITRHDDIIVSYYYHKTTYTCFVKRTRWMGWWVPPFIIDLSLLRRTMLFFVSLSRLFLTCGWHVMDTSNQDRLISVWSSLWSLLTKFVNTCHQVTAQPYYKKWHLPFSSQMLG